MDPPPPPPPSGPRTHMKKKRDRRAMAYGRAHEKRALAAVAEQAWKDIKSGGGEVKSSNSQDAEADGSTTTNHSE